MNEYTGDAFVNRDEPLPVLTLPRDKETSATSSDDEHVDSKRSILKEKLSGSKLKEKLHDAGKRHESGNSLQDRLFSK